MRRQIMVELSALQERLTGHIAAMAYSYSQLCVKADPAALLGVVFEKDGLEKNVEDIAYVGVHEDEKDADKMDLIPKGSNDDISVLSEGITKFYPEFIQTIGTDESDDDLKDKEEMSSMVSEKYDTEVEDPEKKYYLRLTMPPVDDDRKKVITDAVKVIHDATKTQMDAEISYYSARITAKTVGEDKETVEGVKKSVDDAKKQFEETREKMTDDKLKEVEEANKRYHDEQSGKNDDTASDDHAGQKVKL